MAWKRFFRREHWDRERSREIESYLEMETDENIARGVPPEEATYAARRNLGNATKVREEIYRMNSLVFLETLWQDVRFALRMLRKSPGFTVVAVITLALGIGANTAIFSLINAVMLRNLPVYKPDQLVLFSDLPGMGTITSSGVMHRKWDYFSYAQYQYFCDHNQLFQTIGAFERDVNQVTARIESTGNGEPMQQALGTLVSGSFFPLLGINSVLGRLLTPQDDRPGAKPAAVISYAYWKRQFSGKPSALGSVVDLNGTPFTIVGVAPPEFFGVAYVGMPPDFWLPMSMQPQVMQRSSYLADHTVYWLNVVARLKRGVRLKEAEAVVDVQLRQYLMARWGSMIPPSHLKDMQRDIVKLAPGGKGISEMRLRYSEPLHILMLVVALVLLIACANVASMLLARATSRYKEISTRLVVGATRRRLVRQLLAESALLAVAGGALGLLLASWGVRVLVFLVAHQAAAPLNLRPDALVLGFTACVSLLAVMFFGLLPALRASKVDLVSALKAGASGPGKVLPAHLGLSQGLVVFQVALSLPLLIGAGLFLRSLNKIESRETEVLNPTRRRLLLVRIDPRLAGYKPNQLGSLYQQLLTRINALPGVGSSSLAYYSPLSGNSSSSDIGIEGYTPPNGENMDSWEVTAAPDYFKTEGVHLLLGRPFGWQDAASSPAVAVVNEAFAKYFFPNQNPVGRRFSLGTPFQGPGIEIIGVAENVKFNDLRQKVQRMIFLPLLQMKSDLGWLSPYVNDLEIRASGDPLNIAAEVRGAIHEIDRSLPVSDITTLSRQVNESLHQERTVSELSSFFGLLALGLACTGLYGVMSYNVARRTNEIGIRMALGAQRGDVLWLVLRQAMVLIIGGIVVGVPLAVAGARLISSQLYGVKSMDPLTVLLACLVMLTTGLLAGYLPARRAMRVEPMETLRYE